MDTRGVCIAMVTHARKIRGDGRQDFWEDEERLNLLAMLLENVGIDAAVRLAPANVWREALDELEA